MMSSLLLPLLLQAAEPAVAAEDQNEVERRRIATLSVSLRAEAARCYNDYPREAQCFEEAYEKAAGAVEDESEKVAAVLRAVDAQDLANCTAEEAETGLGCSRDLLATHKTSHGLWYAYANSQCTLDGLPSRGGWGQLANYNACFIRMAADRIDAMWTGMGVLIAHYDVGAGIP